LVDAGKTILVVTHDRDLARRVTRTITLADGEIVDEIVRDGNGRPSSPTSPEAADA
jgi:ABC-type lipoprotein export system ATPase subunit